MNDRLLPLVRADGPEREAVAFGDRSLTYPRLASAAAAVAASVDAAGAEVVAVWATPTLETCVAVVGALASGTPVVPVNPHAGPLELEHIVADSAPGLVLAAPGDELPPPLAGVRRVDVDVDASADPAGPEAPGSAPAFVVYTSGTTGPPKGVVLSRAAVAANLDALADAWAWTAADVLAQGLPLFHVHGLILGVLGSLRVGGAVHHVGRFTPGAIAAELAAGASMVFGVPTMYHRLAEEAERDPSVAEALAGARLLVSGSAPLLAPDADRLLRLTGQRVVERYGLSESLILCAARADGDRRRGTVGPPLPGVSLRLVDDDGQPIEPAAGPDVIGEIQARTPGLFLRYLNRPDATAAAMTADGWFRTGDLATRDPDGAVRIVGRRATDLIKSGGFKIGAGEIEAALLAHPSVAEAAVTGEPDPDLGERIVAWVVTTGAAGDRPTEQELADHVAAQLAPHKRPRTVHYLDALPRNAMGKILKQRLPR